MKNIQIIELVGYAFGGVAAASRGDTVTAAKCFILAAASLVDPADAQQYLTAAGVDRANMVADVAEVVKFGALS